MTFKELEMIIEHIRKSYKGHYNENECDDLRICIPVKIVGVVGGTPCVDVKLLSCGFDWDKGKLMIIPEKDLRETTRDEIKTIQDKYEELGNSLRIIRELKKENKKLKEKLNEQS